MAWNGSTSESQKKLCRKPVVRQSANVNWPRVALFGIAACSLLGVLFWLAISDGDQQAPAVAEKSPDISLGERREIKAVDASVVTVETNRIVRHEPETYRDENGVLRYKGGARAPDPERKTQVVKLGVDADGKPLSKPSIFKNRAEHEISRLLTMRPGQPMIGTRRYDARFEEEYKKSLLEPIIITKDDSPRDAALKQAMIDAKLEIQDRMRAGEKLADILEETRSELQRLARYKRDVEKLVREQMEKSDMSDSDIEMYVDAANKLLQEKGVEPIKGNVLVRRNILLQQRESNK